MLLSLAERRLGIAERLARLVPDRRDPTRIIHSFADMIRARIFAICCGYEDADDLDTLRVDPAFKLACGRLPDTGVDLCSQPTLSRLENAPRLRDVIRLTYALVDAWMDSYPREPEAVTLDIEACPEPVEGIPATSSTAISSCRCSTPTMTSAASCRSTSTTRSAAARSPSCYARGRRRPASRCGRTCAASSGTSEPAGRRPASCCAATATTPGPRPWRGARPTACSMSSACRVRSRCRGRSRTPPTLSAPNARSATRMSCGPTPKPGTGQAPGTESVAPWARVEATRLGLDIRFVVTNVERGSPEWVYDSLYCARGQAENLIKLHKSQLRSDRTSCRSALANQVRLVLHTAAYWLMLDVRDAIPKVRDLARAEFTTLRLRLLKVAARIVETRHRVRIAFAAACPRGRRHRRPICGPDPATDLTDGAEPLTSRPARPSSAAPPSKHRQTALRADGIPTPAAPHVDVRTRDHQRDE